MNLAFQKKKKNLARKQNNCEEMIMSMESQCIAGDKLKN